MAEKVDIDDTMKFGEWKQLPCEGTLPCPRYGHCCAAVGSSVYLFGGSSTKDDLNSYNNDLYTLDLREDSYHWKQVEQKGDIPTPREGATLSVIDDELFLFGGIDKEGSFMCADGVFVFKTSSNTWERCGTSGPAPQTLSCSIAVNGHRLVVFGGVLNGEAQNSVHVLDTITLQWSVAETTGSPPSVRCDHACSVLGDKMLVSCGSGGESLWYSDIYQLDLSSMEWSAMDVKGSVPIPRDYTSLSTLVNQYLVLFGGFSGCREDEECFNDLHCIDLSRKTIEWVKCSKGSSQPCPKPRYGHSAITYEKQLFLFSGQDIDGVEFNDVWIIEAEIPMTGFEPVPVPRARYNTSTPIPTPRKVVTPAPLQAVKPRDFDDLRSTYTKRINEMFDTLSEKFQQLDSANATLESERSAFENEKKTHTELYERQQQELKEMFDSHRLQNEQWLEKIRQETDSERRTLAQQRAVLDKASADLSCEQEEFTQKSKKLDAIMKQVQGLGI